MPVPVASARRRPAPTTLITLPDGTAAAGVLRKDVGDGVYAVALNREIHFFQVEKGKKTRNVTAKTRRLLAQRLAQAPKPGDGPLAYRSQHAPLPGGPAVEPVDAQIADAAGGIGRPFARTVDIVSSLHRKGEISDDQRSAGDQFAQTFHRAKIDPLSAHDMAAERSGGGVELLADVVADARAKLSRAMDALGGSRSFAGAAAWEILGMGRTVADYAAAKGWGRGSVNPTEAKGHLKAALGILAAHYARGTPRHPRIRGCGEPPDFAGAVAAAIQNGATPYGRREALACAAGR